MQKTLNIDKELTRTMEKTVQDSQQWAEVIRTGWQRMFQTSDFPIKNLGRVLDAGFSVYGWFMKIAKISVDLVDDISEKFSFSRRKVSHSSADLDKVKEITEWGRVLQNLNEEVVKVLGFLWFADALSAQVIYPEAEAMVHERSWFLIELNFAKSKKELLDSIELVIEKIEANSRAATSWVDVIRLP